MWELISRAAQGVRALVGPKPQITRKLVERADTEVQFFEELGSGRFGVVRRGILRNPILAASAAATSSNAKLPVAIKSIVKSRASMHDVRNELLVLERLQRPTNEGYPCNNVVQLMQAFEDKQTVFVATPLYTGGELFDRISQQRVFTEVDSSKYMLDLLTGVKYCHANLIVHRDVKPENLLFSDNTDAARLVLVDFGMARICEDAEEEMELQCGSPSYVAPEVLERNYTMKCDLWSCGIILHILLVGGTPFGNGTDEEILSRVEHFNEQVFLHSMEQEEWHGVSNEAKALCAKLLTKDAKLRPNAAQSLELVRTWHMLSLERAAAAAATALTDKGRAGEMSKLMRNLHEFKSLRQLERATVRCIAELIRTSTQHEHVEQGEAMRLAATLQELKLQGRVPLNVLADKLHLVLNERDGGVEEGAATTTMVDVGDLVASALTKSVLLDEEYLLHAFKKFDLSGDGVLDRNELARALAMDPQVDSELLNEAMRHADANGDGLVSYEEFAQALRERSVSEETLKKREVTLEL